MYIYIIIEKHRAAAAAVAAATPRPARSAARRAGQAGAPPTSLVGTPLLLVHSVGTLLVFCSYSVGILMLFCWYFDGVGGGWWVGGGVVVAKNKPKYQKHNSILESFGSKS